MAAKPAGEEGTSPLPLHFDRTVKLAFCGSSISSDGGLLLHRELDDALGLTDMAAGLLADPRCGKNGRHRLAGLLRQSIFSRLAGYEDVNDADRLRRDPVMRQIIGGRAVRRGAASASAMGRFGTKIHLKTDHDWLPAAFELTGGEATDAPMLAALIDAGCQSASNSGSDSISVQFSPVMQRSSLH